MSEASPLDHPEVYARLDPSGMRERLRALGVQCRDAFSRLPPLPPDYASVRGVVVAGMGGSAIGGDLAADWAAARGSPLLLSVWRDYGLPPWAGPETLVVASSYSGETEEALSAFAEALRRGAPVVALTSGGRLAREAEGEGIPLLPLPGGLEPRLAVGAGVCALLGLLARLGLLPHPEGEVVQAVSLLEHLAERYGVERPTGENPAKALALRLQGRAVVVYGAGFLAGVARRWKTDLNENAKAWAFVEVLPEAGHNAVVGTSFPPGVGGMTALFLRSPLLPPHLGRVVGAVRGVLEEAGVPCLEVEGEGEGHLAQMLGLVFLGSWTGYYLALLYGVDPSPVPPIARLKERLARGWPGA